MCPERKEGTITVSFKESLEEEGFRDGGQQIRVLQRRKRNKIKSLGLTLRSHR